MGSRKINIFDLFTGMLGESKNISIKKKNKTTRNNGLKIIKNFEVKKLEILDINGICDKKLMPKISKEEIKKLYESMILTRVFDEKALNLQRQGRLGVYASMRGQEASIIGSSYALEKDDWMFPCFRENGALLLKGYPMHQLFMYWGGDEMGMQVPSNVNSFPISIAVGTQTLHAVGAAYANQYLNKKVASIVYFGDGGTSEGDFHEAMNLAGSFKLPVVFFCQNNQYAISVPRSVQSASETIAQKAIAYGFSGIQVDGNDIFAVYKAAKEALDNARAGKGPTLIESYTYRIGDHTTSDDAKKYRNEKELNEWLEKDPIARLEKYMRKNKISNAIYEKKVLENASRQVDLAVKKYESAPLQNPEEIFNYMYSELTPELKEQKEDMLKNLKEENES